MALNFKSQVDYIHLYASEIRRVNCCFFFRLICISEILNELLKSNNVNKRLKNYIITLMRNLIKKNNINIFFGSLTQFMR